MPYRYRVNDWIYENENLNRARSQQVRKAGGEWLEQYPWQSYATLEFKRDTTAHTAKALYKSFITRFGPKFFSAFAVENHRYRHSVHLHCLMGGLFNTNPWPIIKSWRKLYGSAYIYRYDPQRPARLYIWKFMTNPNCELDLYNLPDEAKGQPQLDVQPDAR